MRGYFFLELACEFDVAEVHEVLLGDVGIKVLLVDAKGV